jgi:hypothetical protein
LIDFIELPVDSIITFIEILNMEFDDVADGAVEQVEARRLFDQVGWFGYID